MSKELNLDKVKEGILKCPCDDCKGIYCCMEHEPCGKLLEWRKNNNTSKFNLDEIRAAARGVFVEVKLQKKDVLAMCDLIDAQKAALTANKQSFRQYAKAAEAENKKLRDRIQELEKKPNRLLKGAMFHIYNLLAIVSKRKYGPPNPPDKNMEKPHWFEPLEKETKAVIAENTLLREALIKEVVKRHDYPACGDHPDMYGWVTKADGEFGEAHLTKEEALEHYLEALKQKGNSNGRT